MADTDTTASNSTSAKPATAAANGKTGLTDSIRDAFTGDAPVTEKLKTLYKARPVATAALAGVVGLALLNTLRGRR